MSNTINREADLAIAPADSALRRDYEWSAHAGDATISIVRTSQSSPVWIQANN
ncbi:hypothetical protein [Saccharopolyspora hattusasensis]|uniref:hypothetical protein n=1 Tax=Saccharopolyspora hattusasensis TaxID=1128679 RepID=UPI003D96327D